MLPQAYRPSPRVRQHRVLVRHRRWIIARITASKNKLRHKLAQYNQDVANLFTRAGEEHLAKITLADSVRFEVGQLQEQLDHMNRERPRRDTVAGLSRPNPRPFEWWRSLDSV
jgi:hypothetical protein